MIICRLQAIQNLRIIFNFRFKWEILGVFNTNDRVSYIYIYEYQIIEENVLHLNILEQKNRENDTCWTDTFGYIINQYYILALSSWALVKIDNNSCSLCATFSRTEAFRQLTDIEHVYLYISQINFSLCKNWILSFQLLIIAI